jgi:hypothetical protein
MTLGALARHLYGVPVVLLGTVLCACAAGVAAFFKTVFEDLGSQRFARAYDGQHGIWFMRATGAMFIAIGTYWAIAGTG